MPPALDILIVTDSTDHGVAGVTAALKERAAHVFRFDSDRFPTHARLSVWQGPPPTRTILTTSEGTLDLAQVTAIWFRGVPVGAGLDVTDPELRAAALDESRRLVEAMAVGLTAFQLDPIAACLRGADKLYQHQLAQAVGLRIPRTVVSNDPDEVRRFARTCPGGLITKMHRRFYRTLGGDPPHIEELTTTPVSAEELSDGLAGLEQCPMIFQEEIDKRLELRVTVVGQRCFCAALEAARDGANRYDWRVDQAAHRWRPCELPPKVSSQLFDLLNRLGVNYAACDLIVTPDDRYVFLEANLLESDFGWIEHQTGLPISQAIADLLVGRAPRRV